MISQTSEYALRAMVYLASKLETPVTVQQMAGITKVPPGYLSKVMQGMSRAGLVNSQRGVNGGFTLSRPPEEISVLEVINAVDAFKRIHTCPLGLHTHGANLCPMHRRLDDAYAYIESVFAKSTLKELAHQPNQSVPLCEGTQPSE